MISKLEKAQCLYKKRDTSDNRVFHLYLTKQGRKLNQYVDKASDQKVISLFSELEHQDLRDLIDSMKNIERLLEKIIPIEMEDL